MSVVYHLYEVGLFLILAASLEMIVASLGFRWANEKQGTQCLTAKNVFFFFLIGKEIACPKPHPSHIPSIALARMRSVGHPQRAGGCREECVSP